MVYSYARGITASTSIKTTIKLTDCVGIYNWDKLDNYSFLNAEYTENKVRNKVKIKLSPTANSCFQLQKMPSDSPDSEPIEVTVEPKYAYSTATNIIESDPHMADCRGYVSFTQYGDNQIKIGREMKCSISPTGFIVQISNGISADVDHCTDVKLTGKYQKVVHGLYKDTTCGSLLFNEPVEYSITLRAPFDKYKTHHYVIKFDIADLDMPVVSEVDINEYWASSKWLDVPSLTTSQLPLTWLTSWSWNVDVRVKAQSPYVSLTMHYQLVPDEFPRPETTLYDCPQNLSDSIRNYRYKEHCYSVVTHSDTDKKTWNDAEEHCQSDGGHLLTINKPDELELIQGILKEHHSASIDDGEKVFYIGLVSSDQGHRWVDGNPAVVTDWYQRSPSETQPLPAKFFGREVNFASPTLSQPTNDKSTGCTAMVITSPLMSTNWIKIPCLYPYAKAGYVCKYKANDGRPTNNTIVNPPEWFTSVTKQETLTILTKGKISCPHAWVYHKGLCVRLITSEKPINVEFSCENASHVCRNHRGRIAQVTSNNYNDILLLLKWWKHMPIYGGIWFDKCYVIQGNKSDLIFFDKTLVLETNSLNIASDILNVLCETEPVESSSSCGIEQYECSDGTCILDHHQCDGRRDCLNGEDEYNCICSDMHFQCQDGSCVPMSKYCDFHSDCTDGSDEKNCTHTDCPSGERLCDNGQCISTDRFHDSIIDCLDGSDEKVTTPMINKQCDSFTCYNGECIPREFVNNYRMDCEGNAQEDEAFVEYDIKRGKWMTSGWMTLENNDPFCPENNGSNVRCRQDKSYCFPRHLACIYDTDKYGYMSACSDGSHLLHCEQFECPDMFKCPASYCIPLHKVCDGVVDCTGGADEAQCQNFSCPGLFKCGQEGYCIDQSLVCNGINDCRQTHEDELLCDVRQCPAECKCSGHVINCTHSGLYNIPPITNQARSILLSQNLIYFENSTNLIFPLLGQLRLNENNISVLPFGVFQNLRNLLMLDLRYNSLNSLSRGMFLGLKSLQHLYLDGNPLKIVGQMSFSGMKSIKYISLAGHGIKSVETGAFADVPSLQSLYLSNNSIHQLSPATFDGAQQLKSLNLKGNDISNLQLETFDALKLDELHTDDFKFCCFAKHVPLCTPTGDAFSSCEDLMANGILQVAIWVLGMSALVGNLLVIIWRTINQGKKPDSILIVNLSISDFLMGVYLIIIASADTFYRGRYIMFADAWRGSHLCKFAGFLSTLSSQMSVFMLVVITADRFASIVFPFSTERLTFKKAIWICLVGWVIFTVLCFIPVINLTYFGPEFIKNGVCLLFNLAAGQTPGWEYVTFVFLAVNLLAFIFIFIAYCIIYSVLDKSRKNSKREVSDADIALVKRFILIVVTDFICWIPLIITAFLALAGTPVNPQVSAWMAVFILPLNSAVNPFLYTISAISQMKKRAARKKTGIINSGKTTSSIINSQSRSDTNSDRKSHQNNAL